MHAIWPVVLVLVAAGSVYPDGLAAPDAGKLRWLREYLAEYSAVSESQETGHRQTLSTRIEPHPEPGRAVLSYQRASYAGPGADSIESRQVIQYTVTWADLETGSIVVEAVHASGSPQTSWIVRASIRSGADFVPYTNIFEEKLDGDRVDVTSSKGRVREIIVGYFGTERAATQLADGFRDLLESLDPGTAA